MRASRSSGQSLVFLGHIHITKGRVQWEVVEDVSRALVCERLGMAACLLENRICETRRLGVDCHMASRANA
jgi:hypothetical protein